MPRQMAVRQIQITGFVSFSPQVSLFLTHGKVKTVCMNVS